MDELEEGEIPDDSPVSELEPIPLVPSSPKPKKLRYIIGKPAFGEIDSLIDRKSSKISTMVKSESCASKAIIVIDLTSCDDELACESQASYMSPRPFDHSRSNGQLKYACNNPLDPAQWSVLFKVGWRPAGHDYFPSMFV